MLDLIFNVMWWIASVIAPAFICWIAGIILLRFEAGRVIITIACKIMWLLFVVGIVGIIIGNRYMEWFRFAPFLMFLKTPVPTLFQVILQLSGMVITPIIYKFKLPSKENYTLRGDYILPFTGKWTVVNGGLHKKISHSWGILTQRYAYDFIIVDDEGKSSSGDRKSVHNYHCYGKDIIAPADGVVVKLYNKHKDSMVDGKSAYCNASRIQGNYIIIKHNEFEYSMIAHIMRDSIAVKVGDMVKQGDIIAKCGNTGNSSEPHIHFQLQAGTSLFLSAGLPIAFTNINAQDKKNYDVLDKRSCDDNLQVVGNKSYIGRGLEVENTILIGV